MLLTEQAARLQCGDWTPFFAAECAKPYFAALDAFVTEAAAHTTVYPAAENIFAAFAAELKGVKKAERKEQVCRAARRTGLEAVLPRLIRSLSKGYKQRVGIAQALLGSPRLIILDEPTVGLDPAQVIEIRKLIRELGRAHTVILSSHILSEVQAVCQQILILSKGHLAAAGSLEELTADGKSLEEVFLELTDGESEEAAGEEDAE